MLWLKAWRESEIRFGLGALTLAAIVVGVIGFHREAAAGLASPPTGYAAFIWEVVYKGYLRDVFEIAVLLLGLGGLRSERSHGTVWYTLALPVGRHQLVIARALVGLAEVAALAVVPAVLVPALSRLAGEPYSWATAAKFGGLWTAGGSVIFALGLLASTVLEGEYSAPIGALLLLLGYSALSELPGADRYLVDVHQLMSGRRTAFFDSATFSIPGPLPWDTVGLALLPMGIAVALACVITMRRDF